MRKSQPGWENAWPVFIDETSLETEMARLYVRALRSERCVAATSRGQWPTSIFIGALRCDGPGVPFLFAGGVNAEVFTAYLQVVPRPEL